MAESPQSIIQFWLQAGPEKWFAKDEAFDRQLKERFEALHFQASRNELADWEKSAEGALALILLLDQIPRNIFRKSAHAFATDPLALSIARRAVETEYDSKVDAKLRAFFYLPFEHSESLADQERCLELFERAGDKEGGKWAQIHYDIIKRFGRFPHRNQALGRTTTPEEQEFLNAGGFAG